MVSSLRGAKNVPSCTHMLSRATQGCDGVGAIGHRPRQPSARASRPLAWAKLGTAAPSREGDAGASAAAASAASSAAQRLRDASHTGDRMRTSSVCAATGARRSDSIPSSTAATSSAAAESSAAASSAIAASPARGARRGEPTSASGTQDATKRSSAPSSGATSEAACWCTASTSSSAVRTVPRIVASASARAQARTHATSSVSPCGTSSPPDSTSW
mmetsp:Transcript_20124/g.64301  ORF Transcript_20124/g.64301 Transcript_20124/m.64301 type:complete len:217 (-) Transcript_20124:182-832(-)